MRKWSLGRVHATPDSTRYEAESELTRGYSAMSWGVHGLTPNARVIESVDGDAFFRYICDLVSRATVPPRAFTPAL